MYGASRHTVKYGQSRIGRKLRRFQHDHVQAFVLGHLLPVERIPLACESHWRIAVAVAIHVMRRNQVVDAGIAHQRAVSLWSRGLIPQSNQTTQDVGRWRPHFDRSHALRNNRHQQNCEEYTPFHFFLRGIAAAQDTEVRSLPALPYTRLASKGMRSSVVMASLYRQVPGGPRLGPNQRVPLSSAWYTRVHRELGPGAEFVRR